uniref:Uncharacterized protein n=1 Tax=Panagrolaimus sp. PS1159 TaxID=55785 RepID=A0AC35F3U2_9BILA
MASLTTAVWDELPHLPEEYKKPQTWKEKNFGQWCRNFTVGVHRQCPHGSFIHWYNCCGENNTECCFGIQTTFLVLFGWIAIVAMLCCVWGILLHFDYIYPRKEKKMIKKLENGCEYNNVILKT